MSMTQPSASLGDPLGRPRDGFVVLHDSHQQTLFTLNELAMLVAQLEKIAHPQSTPNANMRAMATAIAHHFSYAEPQHHEDEERHIFAKLALSGDPEIVRTVLQLQQDHDTLEEEWMELAPHIEIVACGHVGYDLNVLREGSTTFGTLLREHIEREESYIYPQAQARLNMTEREAMSREMRARRSNKRETRRLSSSAAAAQH